VTEFEVAVDVPAHGKEISRAGLAVAVLDAVDRRDWSGHVIGVADTPPDRRG
jgi:hypothetical protein